MKAKLLNIAVIISSLLAYLEWGSDQSMFLFQGEVEVLSKIISNPSSVLHPFIIIPMIGQLLLTITLFQKIPSHRLSYWGIAFIALLLLFVFIIGIIGFNYKILISTLPFLLFSIYTIIYHRQLASVRNNNNPV